MHIGFRLLPSVLSCFVIAMLVGCVGDQQTHNKIKITKLDELPQHTYPFTGDLVELVKSETKVSELAAEIRTDIESDLNSYEIGDATTVKGMYTTLLNVHMLDRNYDEVERLIKKVRKLEDKEAKKLMFGLTTQAMITAYEAVNGDVSSPAYKPAFQAYLVGRLSDMPWDVIEDSVQNAKGRLEIFGENLIIGLIQGKMQPVVDKTGELSADMAHSVIGMHFMLFHRLPLKNETVAAYQQLIDANRTVKSNIWSERGVTFSGSEDYHGVRVAVWDSGTDESVFAKQLFVNANETVDGKDDDGNGYIDDVHGIAYNVHAEKTQELLCPLGEAAPRMPLILDYLKGLMDLQAAIDSPEASALKRHISTLSPEKVDGFLEDLSLAGNYTHGTHVAGLMLDGNPFAELLIARLSYDHKTIPVARTVEWGRRDAAKCRDTAEYFKQHGVRVVNMSWGEAQKDAEQSLEKNGIGASAEKRREIAREVFSLQKEGLYEAIKNAPEVLFVAAAGNSDNDVEFDDDIPSSFDLPNLLVVGAVDQAGDPTSFTSFGRTVQVYANGFEVESYVPGGKRMKMSGTSMASPNAANLAGKLLAIDPTLKPSEVIDIIKKGADHRQVGGHSFLLLNPRNSVDLLKAKGKQ